MHALAVQKATETAANCVDKRSKDIEQTLLENLRSELAEFQRQQVAERQSSSALTNEFNETLGLLMKEFQENVEMRIKAVRSHAYDRAEAATSAYLYRHSEEAEKNLVALISTKLAALKVDSSTPPYSPLSTELLSQIEAVVDRSLRQFLLVNDMKCETPQAQAPNSGDISNQKAILVQKETSHPAGNARRSYATRTNSEVEKTLNGLLAEAVEKSTLQFESDEVIQRDLTAMQYRIRERNESKRIGQQSRLPADVQHNHRQIEKALCSEEGIELKLDISS